MNKKLVLSLLILQGLIVQLTAMQQGHYLHNKVVTWHNNTTLGINTRRNSTTYALLTWMSFLQEHWAISTKDIPVVDRQTLQFALNICRFLPPREKMKLLRTAQALTIAFHASNTLINHAGLETLIKKINTKPPYRVIPRTCITKQGPLFYTFSHSKLTQTDQEQLYACPNEDAQYCSCNTACQCMNNPINWFCNISHQHAQTLATWISFMRTTMMERNPEGPVWYVQQTYSDCSKKAPHCDQQFWQFFVNIITHLVRQKQLKAFRIAQVLEFAFSLMKDNALTDPPTSLEDLTAALKAINTNPIYVVLPTTALVPTA